jgi:hypothetical protein
MRGSVQHTAIGTPRKLTTAGPCLHVNECNRFSTVISAAKTDRRLGNAVTLFRCFSIWHRASVYNNETKHYTRRSRPLTKQTVDVLKAWLTESARVSTNLLFPNVHGERLSSDVVYYRLRPVSYFRVSGFAKNRFCSSLHRPFAWRYGPALANTRRIRYAALRGMVVRLCVCPAGRGQ